MSPAGDAEGAPARLCRPAGVPSVGGMDRRPAPALGLPLWLVLGLGLLGLPRVVLHDLGVTLGPLPQAVLAVGPPVVWVLAALVACVPSPVRALVAVGTVHGLVLALTHQLMWDTAYAAGDPTLGGALTGRLDDDAEEVVLRAAATVSSLFTGMVLGLVTGLVAAALRRPTDRHGRGDRVASGHPQSSEEELS